MKNLLLALIFLTAASSTSLAKAADSLGTATGGSAIYNSKVSLEEVLEALTEVNQQLGKKETLSIKLTVNTPLDKVLEEIYQVQWELKNGYKLLPDDLIHLACKAKECN